MSIQDDRVHWSLYVYFIITYLVHRYMDGKQFLWVDNSQVCNCKVRTRFCCCFYKKMVRKISRGRIWGHELHLELASFLGENAMIMIRKSSQPQKQRKGRLPLGTSSRQFCKAFLSDMITFTFYYCSESHNPS